MSRYDEFKAWNQMPPGGATLDAPDGVMSVTEEGGTSSSLYNTTGHPNIQSGDWQVPHQRQGRSNQPTSRLRNGR